MQDIFSLCLHCSLIYFCHFRCILCSCEKCLLALSCPFICLSACNYQHSSHWTDFCEIWLLWKSGQEIQISLKVDKNTGHFTRDISVFQSLGSDIWCSNKHDILSCFHGSSCYANIQQYYIVCTLCVLFNKWITGFTPSQQPPGFVAAFDTLPYLVLVSIHLFLF